MPVAGGGPAESRGCRARRTAPRQQHPGQKAGSCARRVPRGRPWAGGASRPLAVGPVAARLWGTAAAGPRGCPARGEGVGGEVKYSTPRPPAVRSGGGGASSGGQAATARARRRAAASRKASPPFTSASAGGGLASPPPECGHLSGRREVRKAAPRRLFRPNPGSVIVAVNINHDARTGAPGSPPASDCWGRFQHSSQISVLGSRLSWSMTVLDGPRELPGRATTGPRKAGNLRTGSRTEHRHRNFPSIAWLKRDTERTDVLRKKGCT